MALLIANRLAELPNSRNHQAALAVLLGFDAYARPGALLALYAEDVLAPVATDKRRRWAITFFPSTRAAGSKTNTQDDTIYVGQVIPPNSDGPHWADRRWLTTLLAAYVKTRHKHGKLSDITLPELEQRMEAATKGLGFAKHKVVPHRLRHGGASCDAFFGHTADAVRERGQWLAERSFVRYMKQGRYLRELHKLNELQLRRAEAMPRTLSRSLPPLFTSVAPTSTSKAAKLAGRL